MDPLCKYVVCLPRTLISFERVRMPREYSQLKRMCLTRVRRWVVWPVRALGAQFRAEIDRGGGLGWAGL